MDFQILVNSFFSPACIASVQKTREGSYGEIRIVAANGKYTDMIDQRGLTFVPGSLYTEYFPQNQSFEDVCVDAAIKKKEVHTYAHINNVDLWFDIYAMPVDYEDGDICYCAYLSTPKNNPDSLLETFNTSQASNDVLKTCIKLHKANNLKEAMESVISDIRNICKAEGCTVLLLNDDEEEYSILATNWAEGSKIKRVTEFKDFYDIANSWKDMLGDEGDCIIIRNEEEMNNVSRINNPWYLTLVEAGVKSVVLFPLRVGTELLGFIWAINFDTGNTMRIKETLELTTFFASSHIARYKVLKRLENMSYTDAFTGLPNRFACMEHIQDLINKGGRFAIVSIDLNNFKSINDSLGFDAGNRVMIEVTDRWKSVAGREDTVTDNYLTRIAGDEFLLVISGYNSDEVLENAIRSYTDVLTDSLMVDGCELYVSSSFGYAEYPSDADTADALITRANAAMLEIKKANSSEHILRYTPDLFREWHILEIENKIRAALENDNVFFKLQPQYDMDHKLRGFEALARMKDTDGNIISPVEFIPVAEKVGLIDMVDGAVFKKAACFFGELLRKTGADLTLSINASGRHLMKSDFIEEISALLKDSGIPADHLEIEIT